jgi:hypothetical protein
MFQKPMYVYFPTRKGVIQLGPKHISIVGHLSIIIFLSYSPCSKFFSKGRSKYTPWQATFGCTPIHKDQSMWQSQLHLEKPHTTIDEA